MGASPHLGQPFRPNQKGWGLGWEKNKLSRYEIRAGCALPPSITVTTRVAPFVIRNIIYIPKQDPMNVSSKQNKTNKQLKKEIFLSKMSIIIVMS